MNMTTRLTIAGTPIALLAILWAVSIAYGVGLRGILLQAPWYMWDDVTRVPVWLESIDPVALNTRANAPTSTYYDPVELWGLDPDEMRKLLQKHGVLTEEWRTELRERWAAGNIEDLLKSYRDKSQLIFREYFEKIDKEKWAALSGTLRAPLSVLCSGCRPSPESARSFFLRLNAAPRLLCDWVIGSILWLFLMSLLVVPIVLLRDVRTRSSRP